VDAFGESSGFCVPTQQGVRIQDLKYIRANHRIKVREVFVIDHEGNVLGKMTTAEALAASRRAGLDLVEVSPNANPPVCKIVNFGKYRYELAKKAKESRHGTTAAQVKELKFGVNIGAHDYMVKLRHAEDFGMKGMKVKVTLSFRGRQMMHQDLGYQLIRKIIAELDHVLSADNPNPKLVGKNIILMLTPQPARKRVRKYTTEDEVLEEQAAEEESSEESDTADAV
jgi:translation initiation factor IF-3